MTAAPTIETARLRLRGFRTSDIDDLAAMLADKEVVRYVEDGQPKDRSVAEKAVAGIIAHWDREGFGRWAIEERASGEFVGFGGLRSLFGTPEVVYYVKKDRWGKGYATELAVAALDFGFNRNGFSRIVAIAKPANERSIIVMKKLGMKFEKLTECYGIDVVQYVISAGEFQQRQLTYG